MAQALLGKVILAGHGVLACILNLEHNQLNQQAYYDAKSDLQISFNKSEQVYVESYIKPKPGTSSKFAEKYLGPYTITKVQSITNYLVKGDDFPEQSVHVSRLQRRETVIVRLQESADCKPEDDINTSKIDSNPTSEKFKPNKKKQVTFNVPLDNSEKMENTEEIQLHLPDSIDIKEKEESKREKEESIETERRGD